MAIICIEGPSAVGKTTKSYAMAERHQAHVVDEIPPLFAIPPDLEGEALSNWFIEIEERGRSDKKEAKIREAPSAQTTSKALLLGAELRDPRVRIRNTDSRRTAAP